MGNSIGSLLLMAGGSSETEETPSVGILFYTFLVVGTCSVFVTAFWLRHEPNEKEWEEQTDTYSYETFIGRRTSSRGEADDENGLEVYDMVRQSKSPRTYSDKYYGDSSHQDKLLYEEKREERREEQEEEGKVSFRMVLSKVAQVFMLLKQSKMLLLISLMIYHGLAQGFISANFTKDIISTTIGIKNIGFLLSFFGFFNAAGCFLLGKLSDLVGKRIFIIVGFLCHGFFYCAYLYMFYDGYEQGLQILKDHPALIFGSAAVLGVGDSCWTTFLAVIISVFFIENAEPAFSNLNFWRSVGYVIIFLVGPLLQLFPKIIFLLTSLVVATGSIVILQLRTPLDQKQ